MAQFEAKEIGARIAQARKEAGLTQEELAELAPFSYRSLQDYERGLTIPYRQLRDISKLLGQPVEWFLRGDEAEEPAMLARLEAIEGALSKIDRKLDLMDVTDRLAAIEELLRDVARARA